LLIFLPSRKLIRAFPRRLRVKVARRDAATGGKRRGCERRLAAAGSALRLRVGLAAKTD